MQKQGTKWHHLAVLAVLASCGVEVSAAAAADKKESPTPLPPEIVKRACIAAGIWLAIESGISLAFYALTK